MQEKIIILDFGSQVTQLIARCIREVNVYCEIQPFNQAINYDHVRGVILSGSPASVNQNDPPLVDTQEILAHVPILGICYGAQLCAHQMGGLVENNNTREFGRAYLEITQNNELLASVPDQSVIWMSHGDTIQSLGDGFEIIAKTETIPIAAFRTLKFAHPLYAIQFHPEVTHTEYGKILIKNFVLDICKIQNDWTPANYITDSIDLIKTKVGKKKVIMALSGGVDSTVAATLIHRAIGDQLSCIFVDNGLLRKNEFHQVLNDYHTLGLPVKGVEATQIFYQALEGISEPEAKRKIIGKLFIDVFEAESKKNAEAAFLGQGTIYPDVIESVSFKGPSATIKSHHNVGGLPARMNMELVEPLRLLFKDEVRRLGKELNIPIQFLARHPFPGPGLGIRVLGAVSAEKVRILQEADAIYIEGLKSHGLYDEIWQAGAILLPVQSVGVMGDERTYEFTIALRAVTSVDGMTADWARIPHDFLAHISNEIINKVKGVNRVVYDISSKPPATIEWE